MDYIKDNKEGAELFAKKSPAKKPMMWVWVIVGIIIVLVIMLIYRNGKNDDSDKAKASPTATQTATSTATISTSLTSSTEASAKWKTYSAAVYGNDISFRYPNTWTVTEGRLTQEPGYLIQLKVGDKSQLDVNIWPTAAVGPTTLQEDKADLTQTATSGKFNVAFTDIKIGDQPAIKILFSNLSDIEKQSRANPQAAVVNDDLFYSFEPRNDGVALLDQILATFKFSQVE